MKGNRWDRSNGKDGKRQKQRKGEEQHGREKETGKMARRIDKWIRERNEKEETGIQKLDRCTQNMLTG